MGFSTALFLFAFLPLSAILYLIADRFFNTKVKNILLLVLSYIFYALSSWDTLGLFLVLTVITYISGMLIYYAKNTDKSPVGAKCWLFIACLAAALYLLAYKYIPALSQHLSGLFKEEITFANLIVPIGVSFVIFEAVSYIVDIYRGDAAPGSFIDAAIFLSLFSKIVSGPIVLWKDFAPQLAKRKTDSGDIAEGINRIIIGLAKKVIIADTLGMQIKFITVDMAGMALDWQTSWLKALLYFFQLYYDFSGYSDIAIGISRIFGFKFKENFNYPYLSTSISDFWRRWHISLGTWFREYIYIPLGGNRKGNVYVNLFIVFMLTGIWHGSTLNFLAWGMIHGFFIVVERAIRNKNWYKKIPAFIKWVFTISIVFLAWVLFMAPSFKSGVAEYLKMLPRSNQGVEATWEFFLTKKVLIILLLAVAGNLIGLIPEKFRAKAKNYIGEKPIASIGQKVLYLAIFAITIVFIINSSYSPFLYFQF